MKRLSNLKLNAKGKTIVEYPILLAFIAILTFTVLFIILKIIDIFYLDQNITYSVIRLNKLYRT